MAERCCIDGGCLVGAAGHLPRQAFDARTLPGLAWGCNRLACQVCGAGVIALTGVRVASAAVDRAALHAGAVNLQRAVELGWLEDGPECRTYVCRCQLWSEDRVRTLGASEDWDPFLGEHAPPWRCAGHPPTDAVDGVALAGEWLDAELALGRRVEGLAMATPGAWIARALGLMHEAAGERLGDALARGLRSVRADVRSRAADALRLWPELAGAHAAARALATWPEGYLGVPDPLRPGATLDLPLQEVIGYRLVAGIARRHAEEVEDAVRLLPLGYTPSDWLARGLAFERPDILADHVEALLSSTPTAAMVARLVAAAARAPSPALDEALLRASGRGLGPASAWRAAASGIARGALQVGLLAVG